MKSAYKVGDRVRVKRKTPHAPLLKKGDIVQIEAIHPHNGSCKFWNELTESYGYLYPDEFVLLPPGNNDFVTPVEPAVTESTLPPGNNDSVTPVEPAVAESNPPPGNNDSVTPVEPAVTESTLPPADDSVTSVEPAVAESNPPPADDSVTSVEPAVTESNPPVEGEYLALNAVSTYRPRGTARGGEYYRLSYKEGSRVKHVHIRGGNTDSPIAQAKVAEVRSLLAKGIPSAQIATMLRQP
jgi:hypothetical protein